MSNPYTTILGHMTGRQLLRRPGYDIDVEEVLAVCAEHGWRSDWRWHERALWLGCLMSINPDAHSTRELDLTHCGASTLIFTRMGSRTITSLKYEVLPPILGHPANCKASGRRKLHLRKTACNFPNPA